MKTLFLLLIATIIGSNAMTNIDNGLADPEVIFELPETVFEPKCTIFGKPLDLMIVLDSSGSLRNRFHESVDIIRRVVHAVAISEKSARVALVQYSGHTQTYFHFNTYTRRSHILRVLDGLRSISGITKTGKALDYIQRDLSPAFGMRGPEVPKIVFLISDGRTHDYPDDKKYADMIKQKYQNLQIWAYGTGDYVAMEALVNITGDASKIITNKNLDKLDDLFVEWKGTEICEPVPVCIPGADQPLDLAFVVDASNSLEEGKSFREQLSFMHRVLNHLNVHPQAVKVAMITYSSQVYLNFDFNKFNKADDVHGFIDGLQPLRGTTQTADALKKAFDLFDPFYGMREGVPKMAIVLSDGHAATSPAGIAQKLVQLKDVIVVAVAVSPPRFVDQQGLRRVTFNHLDRVFYEQNMDTFEDFFLNYVNFGCPGMDNAKNAKRLLRKSIEAKCAGNAMQVTVRTKKGFTGYIYAKDYGEKSSCIIRGQGDTETSIIFLEGDCGMTKTPSKDNDGYNYEIEMRIQFHTDVITSTDKVSVQSCFFKARVPNDILGGLTLKNPIKSNCEYTLHEFGPTGCVALDGIIGKTIYHRWFCDSPNNYNYLVHDCFAESDEKSIALLDENGCEIDPVLMESPEYGFKNSVFQASSVFMFPGKSSIRYKCKMSLCDKEGVQPCTHMIPPVCDPLRRKKRSILASKTKKGFVVTFDVETRRMNVLDEADIANRQVRYCNS